MYIDSYCNTCYTLSALIWPVGWSLAERVKSFMTVFDNSYECLNVSLF